MVVMAILFTFCADSWARPPQARELCGVIEEINAKSRLLAVRSPKRDEPVKLVWRRDTQFIRNHQFTPSTALKTGLQLCVNYHSPFFGKPFATKVVWVDYEHP